MIREIVLPSSRKYCNHLCKNFAICYTPSSYHCPFLPSQLSLYKTLHLIPKHIKKIFTFFQILFLDKRSDLNLLVVSVHNHRICANSNGRSQLFYCTGLAESSLRTMVFYRSQQSTSIPLSS